MACHTVATFPNIPIFLESGKPTLEIRLTKLFLAIGANLGANPANNGDKPAIYAAAT